MLLHNSPYHHWEEMRMSRNPVRLRPVTFEDADILLKWQCHESTRKYARNTKAPTDAEHREWLRNYLDRNDSVFAMILHNGEPSGALRLDPVLGGLEISIHTDPSKYRQGIAKEALALAMRCTPRMTLFAKVLPENVASHALFKSAGFKQLPGGMYVKLGGERE